MHIYACRALGHLRHLVRGIDRFEPGENPSRWYRSIPQTSVIRYVEFFHFCESVWLESFFTSRKSFKPEEAIPYCNRRFNIRVMKCSACCVSELVLLESLRHMWLLIFVKHLRCQSRRVFRNRASSRSTVKTSRVYRTHLRRRHACWRHILGATDHT